MLKKSTIKPFPMLILLGMTVNENFCLLITVLIIMKTLGKVILKFSQVPSSETILDGFMAKS